MIYKLWLFRAIKEINQLWQLRRLVSFSNNIKECELLNSQIFDYLVDARSLEQHLDNLFQFKLVISDQIVILASHFAFANKLENELKRLPYSKDQMTHLMFDTSFYPVNPRYDLAREILIKCTRAQEYIDKAKPILRAKIKQLESDSSVGIEDLKAIRTIEMNFMNILHKRPSKLMYTSSRLESLNDKCAF